MAQVHGPVSHVRDQCGVRVSWLLRWTALAVVVLWGGTNGWNILSLSLSPSPLIFYPSSVIVLQVNKLIFNKNNCLSLCSCIYIYLYVYIYYFQRNWCLIP